MKLLYQVVGYSFSLFSLVPIFWAVPAEAGNISSRLLLQNKQSTDEETGEGGEGQTGGTRKGLSQYDGGCPEVQIPLTALVYQTIDDRSQPPVTYVGGVTTSANPTIWFYVPYSLDETLTADFVLQDENGTEVYKVSSPNFNASETNTSETGSLISITIPVPIEEGQVYRWYFLINCDSETPIYVHGGIKRIPLEPTLNQKLAGLSPREQAALYQQQRLWYDAIAILANLRRENPTDAVITSEWHNLLNQLELEQLIDIL